MCFFFCKTSTGTLFSQIICRQKYLPRHSSAWFSLLFFFTPCVCYITLLSVELVFILYFHLSPRLRRSRVYFFLLSKEKVFMEELFRAYVVNTYLKKLPLNDTYFPYLLEGRSPRNTEKKGTYSAEISLKSHPNEGVYTCSRSERVIYIAN